MICSRVTLALAALAVVAAAGAQSTSGIDGGLAAVLGRDLKFSTDELVELQRGKLVRHVIRSDTPGEVAVAAAVRVDAPKSAFLDRLRAIERFKQSSDVVQIGRFSDPPALADLEPLTVDRDDFDVSDCSVGDCDVRLPADLIRKVHAEVESGQADAQARGAQLFKQMIVDSVAAYWAGAPGRMLQYDDGSRPIRPADEFRGLLANGPVVGALVPDLPAHLLDFPKNRIETAEDYLYWSKEKFGVAPFITVTHVTIVCRQPPTCVATSKDVYSSRYFDASLGLTIASDAPSNPGRAFFLVYSNRTRANALKGGLSRLRRAIVERRARGSLEDRLRDIKKVLEQK
jgi:hypothetical protein